MQVGPVGRRQSPRLSRQNRWADDRAWIVSRMSMNRIDQYPGRGSGKSFRAQKNPVNVTAAVASQVISPTARTHGVDPDNITMRPETATTTATYPARRAQTAILQCPLCCSANGSSIQEIMREPRLCDQGHSPLRRAHLTRLRVRHRLTDRTCRVCALGVPRDPIGINPSRRTGTLVVRVRIGILRQCVDERRSVHTR